MKYTDSHKTRKKGSSYSDSFKNQKYRNMIWSLEKIYLKKILEEHFKFKKILHLDFACGTGRILEFLETRTFCSIGLDVSHEMLKIANKNVKSKLILGDITKENLLGDRKFNLITIFRFFPNADDDLRKKVLSKINSNIENNGLLVINNHRNKDSIVEKIVRFFINKNYRGLNFKEINLMIDDSNFKLVKVYSMGLFRDSYNKYFPVTIFRIIDIFLGKFSIFSNYGYNQIYVFKKINREKI